MNKNPLLVASLLLLICACKKDVDNPGEDDDHNIITTFSIKFSQAGVIKYEAIFDDPDGPGGANPIRFDEIKLSPGQTYQASLTLTNKSVNPPEDMTADIKTAGNEHLFVYTPTNLTGLNITLIDTDSNGLPIGLETQWQTPATQQTGTMRINLRHIPSGKSATSGSNSGNSDLMIDFVTRIE